MDKFGIFNLLNSFFSAKTDQTEQPQDENSSAPNLLDAVITAVKDKAISPSNDSKTTHGAEKNTHLRPLQSSMLSTMTSHEDFIKRVKQKNEKPVKK